MQDTVFSPAFGNRPSQLVGRDAMLDAVLGGLDTKPGSKERATLLLGQRGFGKTVLLWEIADRARERGFVVASPTVVGEGMANRIIEKIQDDGERYIKPRKGQIVGGTVGALGFTVGLQFDSRIQETKSFAYKLLKLSERLDEQNRGMLILVDEVQANSPEVKQLVSAYLELVGEKRNVAMILAGLPGAISSVLNDRVLTFLNRANRISLGPLAIGDIDAYFMHAFQKMGLRIDSETRNKAARATGGSPYMLQLIGHYVAEYADEGGEVTGQSLDSALRMAEQFYLQDVCETTLYALSDRDIDFLDAMARDEGESKMSDIAQRMNADPDYAQKYRRRLISAGIIESRRRGYVSFAVPYLQDYLKADR